MLTARSKVEWGEHTLVPDIDVGRQMDQMLQTRQVGMLSCHVDWVDLLDVAKVRIWSKHPQHTCTYFIYWNTRNPGI